MFLDKKRKRYFLLGAISGNGEGLRGSRCLRKGVTSDEGALHQLDIRYMVALMEFKMRYITPAEKGI